MIKRMTIMLIAVGVVLGGIFGFQAFKARMVAQYLAAQGGQPQTVATANAEYQLWQPQLAAVGTLRAVNGADLSSQVNGIVSGLHFDSGADVKAGDLLVELRSDDDRAKLQSLEAAAALAKITFDRDQKQLKAQAISQQVVDTDEQNLKEAVAQVASQQALVDYKSIRAPFDGRVGIRQVDLGQYVAAGTALVTLQALNPIYVDFSLPQQALSRIKLSQPVTATIDAFPGQISQGVVSAVSPKVDPNTRNVQVRATLKNDDRRLLPGMYATIAIDTGTPERLITLPQTAISYSSYGDTVYIVDDKGKNADGKEQFAARQVFVSLGSTRGDQIAVLNGVKEGDTVVSAGALKLHNGSPVTINNAILPTADANPAPGGQ